MKSALGLAISMACVPMAFAQTGSLPAAPMTAAVSPTPSGNPALDTDFLLLKAYDFERVPPETALKVGDTAQLRISSIEIPAGTDFDQITIAQPPGNAALDEQGFAIEKVTVTKSAGSDKAADLVAIVAPIKPGQLTLPSLAVIVVSPPSGDTPMPPHSIARTNPFSLEVASAIAANDPKPQDPAPVRPPLMIAFPMWVVIVLGLLALALAGGAIYGIVRWSRNRAANRLRQPAGPPPTEDEAALLALADLEKAGYVRAGHFKKQAFGISEILKNYVGTRYGFDAPECTTREMIARLPATTSADHASRTALSALFERLDVVKFTDQPPSPLDANQYIAEARQYIQSTRKPPTIMSPGTGEGPR